jgi:hypothetical protein
VSHLIAIPMPDGRWIALTPEALRDALEAARDLGLGATPAQAAVVGGGTPERWLDSQELEEATGVHSTTWEARAKTGEVPCLRTGKCVRFKLSEVEAASRRPR